MSDEAPTVALPMREFAHVNIASNHNAALWPIGNRVGLAERKLTWQPAIGLDGEDDLEAGRELTGIGGVQDLLSVRRPAQNAAEARVIGQALCGPPCRRHDENLAGSLLSTNKCYQATVGREAGVTDFAHPCR